MLEAGVDAWVSSRDLEELVLEVWDRKSPSKLIGRFDLTIDYSYYGSGAGELWLDPDTVALGDPEERLLPIGLRLPHRRRHRAGRAARRRLVGDDAALDRTACAATRSERPSVAARWAPASRTGNE